MALFQAKYYLRSFFKTSYKSHAEDFVKLLLHLFLTVKIWHNDFIPKNTNKRKQSLHRMQLLEQTHWQHYQAINNISIPQTTYQQLFKLNSDARWHCCSNALLCNSCNVEIQYTHTHTKKRELCNAALESRWL